MGHGKIGTNPPPPKKKHIYRIRKRGHNGHIQFTFNLLTHLKEETLMHDKLIWASVTYTKEKPIKCRSTAPVLPT